MNKLIPFSKFLKTKKVDIDLSDILVVVDEKEVPLGFVFGRETFIDFLEKMDSAFEEQVSDKKKAYTNPAGKLIDLIEDHLPVREAFVMQLRDALTEAEKKEWIPFDEVMKSLHA